MKMYLTFDQIILVADKFKLNKTDPVIYERELNGNRILTLDSDTSKYASAAKPYGRIYYDAQDRPCVVPDTQEQFNADCMCAKEFMPL